MTNLSKYPLEDGFETTLSQSWDGATGTVNVSATPSFTFPASVTTYVVVNPGKSNMQIAEINAYDGSAKTLTVNNITLEKGASVNSTAQSHAVGSKVIISDNYQFWKDIRTAVNTKVDGNVQGFPNYADATARDAAIPSPTNGMMIYNTGAGEFQVYQAGAWTALASGSTQPNASTTVAGKVEIATTAQSIAGTDTGETGAFLSVLPSDIAKNEQSDGFKYGTDVGGDDDYVIALTPVLTAYTTGQKLYAKMTTANTGACTIDFGPGVKNIKLVNGNNPADGDIVSGRIHTYQYDGTNFVLLNPGITTTTSTPTGIVMNSGTTTKNAADASGTQNIAHGLGATPTKVKIQAFYLATSPTDNGVGLHAITTYNGTTQSSVSSSGDGSNIVINTSFRLGNVSGASTFQTGVVTFDGTNIIITWTKTGSPTGTYTLLWEAETNNS